MQCQWVASSWHGQLGNLGAWRQQGSLPHPGGASAVRSPAALVAAALDGVAGCRLEPGEGAARIMVAIGWWMRWGGGFVVYVCGLCECV